MAIIARDHLTDWKALRPFLGLSRPQEREISESCLWNYGKQKHECLEVWKEMKGKKATYQALIKAAEDAKAQSLTDSVRAILTSRQNTPPHHSEGLNEEVSDRDMAIIARDHLTDWKALRPFLGLSRLPCPWNLHPSRERN
jgi:hypothetical protein